MKDEVVCVPLNVVKNSLSRFHKPVYDILVGRHDTKICNIYIKLFTHRHINVKVKVKSKAIPLQAWTGPEGTRRLSLPDFKTVDT